MKSSKSKKVNRAWLHDHVTDTYVKLAQKEGYRARAAYKLKEIDESFRLVRPGQVIVDLGAAPGAWSQYLRRKLGDTGTLFALDLLPFEAVDGVRFLQGDFRDEAVLAALEGWLAGRPVDLVLSDMAPNLSGIAASDAARMTDLIELAVDFAQRHLRPDGALLVKAFHGGGYSEMVALFKQRFRVVKPVKPKASRDKSAETFLLGMGLRQGAGPVGAEQGA
jgi:23S rRNA (uridine2552-2'-O)-methyltransferase